MTKLSVPWARAVDLPTVARPGTTLARATGVSLQLGANRVLDAVGLEAHAGEVLALVGPNGAGKSSLLGVLSGDLSIATGAVEIDGRPIAGWSGRELALRRSVLPQQCDVGFAFTVDAVVRMGRAPWAGTPAQALDDAVVAAVMRSSEVAHLADRTFPSLSGGERARVALARVLAQQSQILLLDEPTAALDLHHQELVMRTARERAAEGAAVVVVLHDLGLAAAHADRIAVLARGHVVADGRPEVVLVPSMLSEVYEHDIEVVAHPRTGIPLVLPRREHRKATP
jgi:iron complex transport system ATP-binding protein